MIKEILTFFEPAHIIFVMVFVILFYWLFRTMICIDKAAEYKQCTRCGCIMQSNQIFKDHCYSCKNLPYKQVKEIFRRSETFDTGYEPKIEENEET
jgi:hypothetical protein